jgi:hypothetical protein
VEGRGERGRGEGRVGKKHPKISGKWRENGEKERKGEWGWGGKREKGG